MENSTLRMSKNSLASGNLFIQFITSTNKREKVYKYIHNNFKREFLKT